MTHRVYATTVRKVSSSGGRYENAQLMKKLFSNKQRMNCFSENNWIGLHFAPPSKIR